MKRLAVIAICLLAGTNLHAQIFQWAKSFRGVGTDYGYAIAVDNAGNVYTTGSYGGKIDFDPGPDTAIDIRGYNGDIFVHKMDSSGNFIWAKTFGGGGSDIGFSIAVDDSGNVYTTGNFSSSADFDPGDGTTSLASAGYWDIFVQKLDSSGNFLWAKRIGGVSYDNGQAIMADGSGNVYITGAFSGIVDFDPGPGIYEFNSGGPSDVFVLKLDASGNFVWAKSFGGFSDEIGRSMTMDATGHLYIAGDFTGEADFDPGPDTVELSGWGNSDIFVQKMDTAGNYIWTKVFGGVYNDRVYSIKVDTSGNIFTCGFFASTVDFNPGPGIYSLTSVGNEDVFVHKMDSSGNFLWARSFGGSGSDRGSALGVDLAGNVYTTGYFRGTVDFDPGAGTNMRGNYGEDDLFIQKMDASGNFLWATSFGGMFLDYGRAIAVTPSGSFYTTGDFHYTIDFNPDIEVNNLTSIAGSDIFVLKMLGQTAPTVGVGELHNLPGMTITPNPGNGLIEVSFQEELSNVEITVTDVLGKIVYANKFAHIGKQQLYINGAAGVYFLRIKTLNGQHVVKLIKE